MPTEDGGFRQRAPNHSIERKYPAMDDPRLNDFNPYAPPQTVDAPPARAREEELILPCPNCASENAAPAPYNWWRGRRAPKAIQHVVCDDCRCEYNGETGHPYPPARSPVLWFVLALLLFLAYFSLIFVGAIFG
jgi:hypothetical protein